MRKGDRFPTWECEVCAHRYRTYGPCPKCGWFEDPVLVAHGRENGGRQLTFFHVSRITPAERHARLTARRKRRK